MNRKDLDHGELRQRIIDALLEVAPDIQADSLDPGRPFRVQFDFDSMDYLNFVTALHKSLGVDIPEPDYPQLATVDGCVHYLSGRLDLPPA